MTQWKELYKQIQQKAKMPFISKEIYHRTAIVREMYVDLGDLRNQLTQKGVNPTLIYLFADVVKIPDHFTWNLRNNGLIIFARRVEVGQDASIIHHFGDSQSPEFIIYAGEVSDRLKVIGNLSGGKSQTIYVQDFSSLGKIFSEIDQDFMEVNLTNLNLLNDTHSSDLQIILSAIFQYATILFYEQPAIAFSQLKWIKECTRTLTTFDAMFCQASSLIVQLKTSMSNANFVPYLSSQIYTQSVKTLIEVAHSYEQEYSKFSNINRSIEERKKSATLLLQHYQDTLEFSNHLLEQTKENCNAVKNAVKSIQADFTTQKNQVELTKIKFKFELGEWKRKKELEAVVHIIMGVMEFVGAISAMCVGDEAAAPAAEQSAQSVAKSALDFSKLMKKISALIQLMNEIYHLSEKISSAANNIAEIHDLKKTLKQETIIKLDAQDLTISAEWDNFKEEVDTYLTMAIDAGIPQAVNYKLQLDKLIVYGKNLAQNQIALVNVSQELVKLLLQKEVEQKQITRISTYIEQMTEDEEENVELSQIVYEQYLNIKRQLFISIINYSWAYKYWALQDSRVKPVISDSISELNDALSNIQNDYQNALQLFNPPPQKFSNLALTINDVASMSELKQTQELEIPIPLTNEMFQGFERVRVSTIRIWIHGIKTDTNKVAIRITNSGNYQDIYNKQAFSFTTTNLQRLYEYEIDTKKIIVDGTIADEEKFAYFVPTPFATWKIDLSSSANRGLDLSGADSLTIEFFGDMIADMEFGCDVEGKGGKL